MAGAALGSKLLFGLEDPQLTWHHLHDPAYLMGGKTLVGALAFGMVQIRGSTANRKEPNPVDTMGWHRMEQKGETKP